MNGESVSPTLGSSGDDDERQTIRVVEITTEQEFVDVGDEGESLGDEFVFSSKLLKGGEEVGHAGVVCTIVSLERLEAQCQATACFDDGQVTAQVENSCRYADFSVEASPSRCPA